VKIQVFYPVDGVSRVQKLQMMTQKGENVCVRAIRGNFDDAQSGVKRIFADASVSEALDKKGVFLSSANSINWGRLAPQIVYYVSAYCDLVKQGAVALGDVVDVCVPTGNFGNIFAAFIAKKMGLPLGKLICASNTNNVLTDFIKTGVYDRNRPFHATMSPSMDILISSNLERLLYLVCGYEKTAAYMQALADTGRYEIDADDLAEIQRHFAGFYTDEGRTEEIIRETYNAYGYLADTHTAVGIGAVRAYQQEGGCRKIILASTASPYKFAYDVYRGVTGKNATDEVAALEELTQKTGVPIPAPLQNIGAREIRFPQVVDVTAMTEEVLSFAEEV
jgi:threonine synthase